MHFVQYCPSCHDLSYTVEVKKNTFVELEDSMKVIVLYCLYSLFAVHVVLLKCILLFIHIINCMLSNMGKKYFLVQQHTCKYHEYLFTTDLIVFFYFQNLKGK